MLLRWRLPSCPFAYLAVLGVARLKPRPAVIALLTLASIFTIGMSHVMPLIYLLIGYWLPALLVLEPNLRLEQQLLDFSRPDIVWCRWARVFRDQSATGPSRIS